MTQNATVVFCDFLGTPYAPVSKIPSVKVEIQIKLNCVYVCTVINTVLPYLTKSIEVARRRWRCFELL